MRLQDGWWLSLPGGLGAGIWQTQIKGCLELPAASNNITPPSHPLHCSHTHFSVTITSPLFTSPFFGLLCCHGYPQPALLCGVRSCHGSALRSPDAGCLHQWPLSHATSFNLPLIKSALPLCSRERLLSFCLHAPRFSNLLCLVFRVGKKGTETRISNPISTSVKRV